MFTLKKITFRNFRSYGKNDTVVEFLNPGTTLIAGRSDDGTTTNGHGKTSLLFCLTWLMYDKVIDSVNKDELINNTNKVDMWGQAEFSVDENDVVVSRWRKSGKNNRENGAKLEINGIDVTPASVDDVTSKVEELVGIDFELFSRIVVFSASNKSFFNLPTTSTNDANQTSMVEQLFELELLSEKASVLKKHIKTTEVELATQKQLIAQVDAQVIEHQTLIDSTRNRANQWQSTNATQIARIQSNLELVDGIDFDAERQLHKTIGELSSLKTEISTAVQSLNRTLDSTTDKITARSKEAASLANSTCPYCHQHFEGSAEQLRHIDQEISALTTTQRKLTVQVEQLTTELKQTMDELAATKSKSTVDDFERLLNLKSQHQELASQLRALQEQTNPFTAVVAELESAIPTSPSYDTANELTSLQHHQQFLLKLLTKKDSFVRKTLLHKSLPFLNERLEVHLTDLGLPHRVEFTPNLTALITQFGRELSYGCLSNGQKARVNFALSLAFGDVLQYVHQKINVQLFDEVFDVGLDRHGILAAADLLKRKARKEGLSVFIISHRDEVQDLFDRTLVVRQVDGFSQLSIEQ